MPVSEASVQESHSVAKRNRGRRGHKSTSKIEENRSLNALTIESTDTNTTSLLETIVEEPVKPRWILLPSECQRFKIRFRPEETGHYEETFALTLVDGNCVTHEVNVIGIADIPRLDMNPKTIFPKVNLLFLFSYVSLLIQVLRSSFPVECFLSTFALLVLYNNSLEEWLLFLWFR